MCFSADPIQNHINYFINLLNKKLHLEVESATDYQKRKQKKEYNERNHIEGKFGQAKQAYGLNSIKAKLSNTPHIWIGAIIFITNLIKLAENYNFKF